MIQSGQNHPLCGLTTKTRCTVSDLFKNKGTTMKTLSVFIGITIILYFLMSFALWNINWFNDLGTWDISDRVFLILEYIIISGGATAIYHFILKGKKQ